MRLKPNRIKKYKENNENSKFTKNDGINTGLTKFSPPNNECVKDCVRLTPGHRYGVIRPALISIRINYENYHSNAAKQLKTTNSAENKIFKDIKKRDILFRSFVYKNFFVGAHKAYTNDS